MTEMFSHQIFSYFMGFTIGFIIGFFYFAGLWITVKKIRYKRRPDKFLAFSTAARLLPTLTVMFLLMRKDPGMFLAMLIAFFIVRFIMIKRIA